MVHTGDSMNKYKLITEIRKVLESLADPNEPIDRDTLMEVLIHCSNAIQWHCESENV